MWKIKLLCKSLGISVSFSSFVGVILSFVVFPQEYWWIGLIVFLSTFVLSFVVIYLILRNIKRHRISGRGSILIESLYGDILKIKSHEDKPVIVIPVNSSFDTIVENDLNIKDRIVEGSSIHGQWLTKYGPDEPSLKKLQKDVCTGIKNQNLVSIHKLQNKRGNKNVYPLGSYIFVERDDYTFLLFALTEFDEHNKVIRRDAETFVELMAKLINSTDYCAGRHVYVPLMGTKIALFGITPSQSFEYIKSAALNKKLTLRASLTIVIFDNDRDKVSIYD